MERFEIKNLKKILGDICVILFWVVNTTCILSFSLGVLLLTVNSDLLDVNGIKLLIKTLDSFNGICYFLMAFTGYFYIKKDREISEEVK